MNEEKLQSQEQSSPRTVDSTTEAGEQNLEASQEAAHAQDLNDSPETTDDDSQDLGETEETDAEKSKVWGEGIGFEVSSSKLNATIEISREHAELYTPEDIIHYLKENHIVYGLLEKAIKNLFKERRFGEKVTAAKGKAEKNGEDGYVEWDIDLSILDGAKLVERGGRVDWKEQHHVLPVKENQRMARLIDPTEGTPGSDVYGNEIAPKPGKPAKLPTGKGTRISEDQHELFAALDGVVCREGEKVCVTDVYTHTGDVNYESGNIRSNTTVVIKGGVMTGFVIESPQDIHIEKLLEGAALKAVGNIYLSGGVQGDNKANISAGGDVVVKFVNNATIEAGGSIIVNGAVTNSVLRARGEVIVSGSKAVVMGGKIYAERAIEADTFGSEIGAKTQLFLGQEIQGLIDKRSDLQKKIQTLLENYKKLKQAKDQLDLRDKQGQLTDQQKALRLKIVRSAMLLQGQIKQLREEDGHLATQIEQARHEQRGVIAREKFWPGVSIQIMDETYPVKNIMTKALVSKPNQTIEIFGYKDKEEKSKTEKSKDEKTKDEKTKDEKSKTEKTKKPSSQ